MGGCVFQSHNCSTCSMAYAHFSLHVSLLRQSQIVHCLQQWGDEMQGEYESAGCPYELKIN